MKPLKHRKIPCYWILATSIMVMIAGCNSDVGPDSISTRPPAEISCARCHGEPIGTRRQILGDEGDFNKFSHHVIDYGNRPGEIITSNDCIVCHDMDDHTSGTIRLKDLDKPGHVIEYDPANPASAELFCLSCHDPDGATTEVEPKRPFSSTNILGTIPNEAGDKIKESWEKLHGHQKKGITCLGDGTPGTGCHGNYDPATGGSINAHGSGNVGLLANKLTLPPSDSDPDPIWTWNESQYQLCLDCHLDYPNILSIAELAGVAEGGNYENSHLFFSVTPPYSLDTFMVTNFHDYSSFSFSQLNLHLYHLTSTNWNYRGSGNASPASCVTCHNVHGAERNNSYLWDQWGFSVAVEGGTEYGTFPDESFSNNFYPQYCANECHSDIRYPRSPFNEVVATASKSIGTLVNGDTVTISFSDSTNGTDINESNIDTVLDLDGNSWVDSDKGSPGELTAAWSSSDGKSNNILTITIFAVDPPAGDPTVAVGDKFTFDGSTITDATSANNPVPGKVTILGISVSP